MGPAKGTLLRTVAVGALLASILVSACGEESATAPDEFTAAGLTGSWEGSAFSISSVADPETGFDLIEAGGAIMVSVEAGGNFTGTTVIPGILIGNPDLGALTIPLAGVMQLIDDTTMRIDFVPEIPPMFTRMDPTFTLNGNALTILDDAAEFDFDADGATEPSVYRITFAKN